MTSQTFFTGVKAEPREVELPSTSHNYAVKEEQIDPARIFLDRGLPVPEYAEKNIVPSSAHHDETFTRVTQISKAEEKPKIQEDRATEETPKLFTTYVNAEEIAPTPENAIEAGLGMVKALKEKLKQLELGSKLRKEVWNRDVANLESQGSPRTLIAVCGATGAGKSSILNAVLDDNVVPTSGMRACTAVVTELSYHNKPTIDADISFLSEAEWRAELSVLLHDLVDEDGNIKRFTDLKSDSGVAWSKVHAVYPRISQEDLVKMNVDQILGYDQQISRILGTTKVISAKDSKSFAKEIAKYIDSKDQKRGKKDTKEKPKEPSLMDKVRKSAGMPTKNTKSGTQDEDAPALWPLIRLVSVRCRAEALSTGAVLVDLPGVADANAARNNIAKDYMKKCNCIWILAPITRAVDDKTARDLLGDAFKMQLMNGNYDDHAITFIASKCDDISCSEVIRALRLEDEPVLVDIEDRLDRHLEEISEAKKAKRQAEKTAKDIEAELKEKREEIREFENHLEAIENGDTFVPTLKKKKHLSRGKKRKSSFGGRKDSPKKKRANTSDDELDTDSDSGDSTDCSEDVSDNEYDSANASEEEHESHESEEEEEEEMNEVTAEDLKEKIKEAKNSIKALREQLNGARTSKKDAGDSLSSLEKALAKVQKEKNAFCSLKRSEFSRDVLKEDFRVGLKDLDDAAAEERDPENFNPNNNLRDYNKIDLPVFTCSSRDYVRLKGQVKGDGGASCFSNVEDTGIPALQKWCHQLTIASRERSARTFLTQIKAFAQSIQSYVQGIGDVTAIDREALREKWESRGFYNTPDPQDAIDPLDTIIDGLGGGLGAGLYNFAKPVLKVDPHGQPTGIADRLCTEFVRLNDEYVHDLQQKFKDGLEDKCKVGAANAADAALTTLDEFTSSMHWATYRATLRRYGSWRRDLNVELINPFTRNIAHSWGKVFESDLFGPFQTTMIAAINALVKEVEESAASGLKDRARAQGEVCTEEARIALAKTVELVKETMNREQKEVSRCMAPHVQAQLTEGYDTAMLERGTGSVARQKAYFRRYVDDCKDDIFDDGADVVLGRLTKAADAIGATLDDAMSELAKKIEVSLAVLWEGVRDDPAQLKARKAIIDTVKVIQEQIALWTEAYKMKHEAARLEDDQAMLED